MSDESARYVGIDVGSTSTKAVAFDVRGTPLAAGRAQYATVRAIPGHAEQSAMDWYAAVESAVGQIAAVTDLRSVVAVGITSQVDTHVPVDEQFRPLRPALLWQDLRSSPQADELNERLGVSGRFANWGSTDVLDASNPVPRALWLARHEPDVWAKCRWLMLPKDFVNARLTGNAGADAWGSFKIAAASDSYVAGIAQAPGLAERLAPLTEPDVPVGQTLHEWHGIPEGTPIATGTMDGMGNVLGSGLARPGDAMAVIGTSVIVAAMGPGGTSGPGVVNFAPYRGRQVHAGPTQSGGDSLRWWSQLTGRALPDVLAAADLAPAGAGGVVFAPHLLGERAPLWDSDVRAWFTGLNSATDFADISRAIIEGVAHSLRELLEAVDGASSIPARTLRMSGGGSQSELWCQVVADVTGREVARSREPDTAVVGAAILAAAAVTGSDPWDTTESMAQADHLYRPDPSRRELYDIAHGIYRETYTALQDVHTIGAGTEWPQNKEQS